ncbi:MAG TPA: FAD-dependent monooxygenase, partial [Methylophilaceae bacterium]|nr:FAD-dependent monooxygenase [Methylophilaceae bacterium]
MTQPSHIFDVLIVGGGLVGSSCAVAMSNLGLRVGILDKKQLIPQNLQNAELNSRIYTISPSNAEWLRSLGIWERLVPDRISFIDQMEIWGDKDAKSKAKASLEFTSYGTNLSHLAYVIEEQVLQSGLWSAFDHRGVDVLTGEPLALESAAKHALLHLADGRALQSRLVIAADGGDSAIRSLAGIPSLVH